MRRAVVLAGGRGTRLAPLTVAFPKPLVPIGEVPILEILVRQLRAAGIQRITMAVGYMAELIMAYFHGRFPDITIEYSREESPLGTAGPLTLAPDLDERFILMNGDVLTSLHGDALELSKAGGPACQFGAHRHVRLLEAREILPIQLLFVQTMLAHVGLLTETG